MKKTLSILVQNRPGVLSHVAGLITRRGYNVESIAAGPTENVKITRITLVAAGDEPVLDQIVKQVRKLVDVISVEVMDPESITGELAVVTVSAEGAKRGELINLINILGLTLTDVREDSLTVMAAGQALAVEMALTSLGPFGIKALARTGLVALTRPDGRQSKEDAP